ncbi:hypothetical protein LIER_33135 [Lithospermum erythrorhizon]|uniref:Uncharacterized protein n=1 Tax=Lithospermum erythrorhizon TaxID=34254 RepID=A0AAV3RZR5_LITER
MASIPGSCAILSSNPLYSQTKSSILSGRKFYGGIMQKKRPEFHVSISSVATQLTPAQEQVLLSCPIVTLA